jgi:hypothetical protein
MSEVMLATRPYHSITIRYSGGIVGGQLTAETGHKHGRKVPRWFTTAELQGTSCHPRSAVEKPFAAPVDIPST